MDASKILLDIDQLIRALGDEAKVDDLYELCDQLEGRAATAERVARDLDE